MFVEVLKRLEIITQFTVGDYTEMIFEAYFIEEKSEFSNQRQAIISSRIEEMIQLLKIESGNENMIRLLSKYQEKSHSELKTFVKILIDCFVKQDKEIKLS